MGWLFQNDKLRRQTPAEYVAEHFTHDGDTTSAVVLATATVRGTVYAAIRNTDKQTGASYVFCAVILFRNNDKEGFGYKSMDEGMGPCEVDCPERILRRLSPIAEILTPAMPPIGARGSRPRTRNAERLPPWSQARVSR